MNWLCRFGIHKWTKFVQDLASFINIDTGQKQELTVSVRSCEKCGICDFKRY